MSGTRHGDQKAKSNIHGVVVMSLPPGPRTPAFYNLLHYMYRPDSFFAQARAKYGVNFSADLAGLGRFVFLGEPAAIRDVFLGDPEVLRTGEANAFAVDTLGPNSVLTLDGEEHARQRKALTPPFLARHINRHVPTLRDICQQEIGRWQVGVPVKLENACREMSLQAILRLVFGMQQGSELDELAVLLRKITHLLSHPMAFAAPLLPSFLTRPIKRLQQSIDDALYRLIEAKRASASETQEDMLANALTMRDAAGKPLSNQALRDHLFTLLMAGHDTTAIAIAWALGDILSHPNVLARLHAELDEVVGDDELCLEHFKDMPYLDAAIEESLRLRPLVDYSVRYLKAPFSADGITYPAGITLAPCTLLVHMRADIYPEPETFNPERFLARRPDPYAWIPFGGGRRRCLGMKFALLEMRVVLATVLQQVRFAPQDTWRPRMQRRGLFLAPSDRASFMPIAIKPGR